MQDDLDVVLLGAGERGQQDARAKGVDGRAGAHAAGGRTIGRAWGMCILEVDWDGDGCVRDVSVVEEDVGDAGDEDEGDAGEEE